MSKFPEYKHDKGREYFDRALKVIPAGIYGHLEPSEGLWIPINKWYFFSERLRAHISGTLTATSTLTICVLTVLTFWATTTPTLTLPL